MFPSHDILGEKRKINIGICWSASITGESYDGKVFDLKFLESIIKNPKINVYSLQVGDGKEDIAKYGYENDIIDLTDKLTNFAKTASMMNKLDLVISSDTSVAHLAGAINKQVWIPLQKIPDWRWEIKVKQLNGTQVQNYLDKKQLEFGKVYFNQLPQNFLNNIK